MSYETYTYSTDGVVIRDPHALADALRRMHPGYAGRDDETVIFLELGIVPGPHGDRDWVAGTPVGGIWSDADDAGYEAIAPYIDGQICYKGEEDDDFWGVRFEGGHAHRLSGTVLFRGDPVVFREAHEGDPLTGYERYRLDWMADHGYGLDSLVTALGQYIGEFYTVTDRDTGREASLCEVFDEWQEDHGFGGQIWSTPREYADIDAPARGDR